MRGTARRERWVLLASVVATFVNSMQGNITLKATLLSTGAVSSERRPECSRAPDNATHQEQLECGSNSGLQDATAEAAAPQLPCTSDYMNDLTARQSPTQTQTNKHRKGEAIPSSGNPLHTSAGCLSCCLVPFHSCLCCLGPGGKAGWQTRFPCLCRGCRLPNGDADCCGGALFLVILGTMLEEQLHWYWDSLRSALAVQLCMPIPN